MPWTLAGRNEPLTTAAHPSYTGLVLPILTAAALGAAGYLGYAAMTGPSQIFGRTVVSGLNPRALCLTFDDGPDPIWTPRILDVLARHEAKATFFFIGSRIVQHPQIARAVLEAGHAIGNHTYSHPNLIFCSRERVRREIFDCQKAIQDAIGQETRLFRPPFGGRHWQTLRWIREAGMTPVLWRLPSNDWKLDSSHAIAVRISRARGGDIILLHDGSPDGTANRAPTVQAVNAVLASASMKCESLTEMTAD